MDIDPEKAFGTAFSESHSSHDARAKETSTKNEIADSGYALFYIVFLVLTHSIATLNSILDSFKESS